MCNLCRDSPMTGVLACSAGADKGSLDGGLADQDVTQAREAAKLAVRCALCEEPAKLSWLDCPSCTARAHLTCLAKHFIEVKRDIEPQKHPQFSCCLTCGPILILSSSVQHVLGSHGTHQLILCMHRHPM